MAIYSYSLRGIVSRGAGKSSVSASAYLCRSQFRDERTGQIHDWRQLGRSTPTNHSVAEASAYMERSDGDHGSRQHLLYSGLYGPAGAPEWTRGKEHIQEFWNRAEQAERRRDAQIAEKFIIALPKELSLEQNVQALQDHIRDFTRQGRVVQVAIHSGEHDPRNVHAHLLVSLRGVDEHGFKAQKAHEQQDRYLHRSEYINKLRDSWEHAVNRHLERHGIEQRIDHRTLKEQGVDREPSVHMGPAAAWRERNGLETDRGMVNRAREARNAERQTSRERVHSGWGLRIEDIAAKQSPEYEKALGKLVDLQREHGQVREALARENREAHHTDLMIASRRQEMGAVHRFAHDAGLGGDPKLHSLEYQHQKHREQMSLGQRLGHGLGIRQDGELARLQQKWQERADDIGRIRAVVHHLGLGVDRKLQWAAEKIAEARERLGGFGRFLHDTGSRDRNAILGKNPDLARLEAYHAKRTKELGAVRVMIHRTSERFGLGHDRQLGKLEDRRIEIGKTIEALKGREKELPKEIEQAKREAGAALEAVRPEAERELAQHQRVAEQAREALRQHQRQREHDRGQGWER